MAISNYLQELINQKSLLAQNLTTKGVSASSNETFNTLVPKVLNITSGGSSTPTMVSIPGRRLGYNLEGTSWLYNDSESENYGRYVINITSQDGNQVFLAGGGDVSQAVAVGGYLINPDTNDVYWDLYGDLQRISYTYYDQQDVGHPSYVLRSGPGVNYGTGSGSIRIYASTELNLTSTVIGQLADYVGSRVSIHCKLKVESGGSLAVDTATFNSDYNMTVGAGVKELNNHAKISQYSTPMTVYNVSDIQTLITNHQATTEGVEETVYTFPAEEAILIGKVLTVTSTGAWSCTINLSDLDENNSGTIKIYRVLNAETATTNLSGGDIVIFRISLGTVLHYTGSEYEVYYPKLIDSFQPASSGSSAAVFKTVDEAYAIATALNAGDTDTTEIYVAGKVGAITSAYSSQYNNITFTLTGENYQCRAYRAPGGSNITSDSFVVIKGYAQNYNGTCDFSAPEIISVVTPPAGVETDYISITEAITIGESLANRATTTDKYFIYGKVGAIKSSYSSSNNNITIYLVDVESTYSGSYTDNIAKVHSNGIALGYRVVGNQGASLQAGDFVVLEGYIQNYNTLIEIMNATYKEVKSLAQPTPPNRWWIMNGQVVSGVTGTLRGFGQVTVADVVNNGSNTLRPIIAAYDSNGNDITIGTAITNISEYCLDGSSFPYQIEYDETNDYYTLYDGSSYNVLYYNLKDIGSTDEYVILRASSGEVNGSFSVAGFTGTGLSLYYNIPTA